MIQSAKEVRDMAEGLVREAPDLFDEGELTLCERVTATEVAAHRTHPLVGTAGGLAYRILVGQSEERLMDLKDGSADLIVTSPPYFWQRDYEHEDQIGHEASIKGYVDNLSIVFTEAKRVLAQDGVMFLNLGDAYYNAKGRPHGSDKKHKARQMSRQRLRAVDGPGLGLPRKSLIGLPWRVALRLQEDGWTLRSSIIWHRPNSLAEPTSHDRPWRTHENLFLFTKGPRYRFNREGLPNGQEDVWDINSRPNNPYAHCAPYPEELVKRCIDCCGLAGGTLLDPFLGSGTSMLAALGSGMNAVGIDLNPRYAGQVAARVAEIDNPSMKPPRRVRQSS